MRRVVVLTENESKAVQVACCREDLSHFEAILEARTCGAHAISVNAAEDPGPEKWDLSAIISVSTKFPRDIAGAPRTTLVTGHARKS